MADRPGRTALPGARGCSRGGGVGVGLDGRRVVVRRRRAVHGMVLPQSAPPGAGRGQPGRLAGRRPRTGGGGGGGAPVPQGTGGAGEHLSEPAGRAHQPHAVRRAGESRRVRSEEHTSELQSLAYLVCRLLLEKKTETFKEASERPITNVP